MKELTKRERRRRMYLNMHRSISNKMQGVNLIWWNSLTIKSQYSFLFKVLEQKKNVSNFKLKHFINSQKKHYRSSLVNIRDSSIDFILKESKKSQK